MSNWLAKIPYWLGKNPNPGKRYIRVRGKKTGRAPQTRQGWVDRVLFGHGPGKKYMRSARRPGESAMVLPYSVRSCMDLEGELIELARKCAITKAGKPKKSWPGSFVEQKRFDLARELVTLERKLNRRLSNPERRIANVEWVRVSQEFIPSKKDHEHFEVLLKAICNVCDPIGAKEALQDAIDAYSRIKEPELFALKGFPKTPELFNLSEIDKRAFAFHKVMAKQARGTRYFLGARDLGKAIGVSHETAANSNKKLLDLLLIAIARGHSKHMGGGNKSQRYDRITPLIADMLKHQEPQRDRILSDLGNPSPNLTEEREINSKIKSPIPQGSIPDKPGKSDSEKGGHPLSGLGCSNLSRHTQEALS